VNAVLRSFVAKDLYFARPVMIGSVLVALLAIPLLSLGSLGRYAAMILMVCAGAVPNFFICGMLVVTERKERVNLFTLGLPISGAKAALAKALAAATAYIVPWTVMLIGTFVLFAVAHAPKGLLPFGTMAWVFLFDQFCLVLTVTLTSKSEALFSTVIVVCNVSISFYFYSFLSLHVISDSMPSAVAAWSPFVLKVIAIELLIGLALLSFTFWHVTRQRDFI